MPNGRYGPSPTAPPVAPTRLAAGVLLAGLTTLATLSACRSPESYRREADHTAYRIIQEKQRQALGESSPFSIETPGDTLRRRLLLAQGLPVVGPESLGVDVLPHLDHWPDHAYQELGSGLTDGLMLDNPLLPGPQENALTLSLTDALQIAAASSRDYQSQKEAVYRAALALDLERDQFRATFTNVWTSLFSLDADNGDGNPGSGLVNSASLGASQRLTNGIDLSSAIAVDVAQILGSNGVTSRAVSFDASISIPLLRGAGEHIVAERLTQAERDAVYAIWSFERFKKTFAVDIASDYLSVLQQQDRVRNETANYVSAIQNARTSAALNERGRRNEIEVGQAIQNELNARSRWINAIQSYDTSLDRFRVSLGLPPDAFLYLQQDQLEALAQDVVNLIPQGDVVNRGEGVEPEDIELLPQTRDGAGPFELDPTDATLLAFNHRLDLRQQVGAVFDAQRAVVVAADGFLPELTLLGRASTGSGRGVGSATLPDAGLRFDQGTYSALLTLDLPFERTAERNSYRNSLIALERSVRDTQDLEDSIKLQLRSLLRGLALSRESLRIQAKAVELAERRVESTRLFYELGRDNTSVRDLVEAQNDLIDARNALTNALVDYRVAEWQLQRDTGVLQVTADGTWDTIDPESLNHLLEQARANAYASADPAQDADIQNDPADESLPVPSPGTPS